MPDASQIPGPHLYIYAVAAVMTALLVPLSSVVTEYFKARKDSASAGDDEEVDLLTEIRDGVQRLVALHEQAADDQYKRAIEDRLARGERERGELLRAVREMLGTKSGYPPS